VRWPLQDALEILRQQNQGTNRPANKAQGFARNTQTTNRSDDLSNEHFLITSGATREPIDPVRFISNRSSGRMGFALAEAARDRGADVTVVAGITSIDPPAGVRVVHVSSAEEMRIAVTKEAGAASVFIAAAAVSDYRATEKATSKIKKSEAEMVLKLERTADILSEVAQARKNGQLLIGFAAETDDLLSRAREKLVGKGLDAIVANDVSRKDAGIDSENNAVVILLRDNPQPIELPLMSKLETAHRILDEVVKLRRASAAEKAESA
jgi:phosphopantothenoylcysteine decarboxylase/phosphopantothenate--cysteine ligase